MRTTLGKSIMGIVVLAAATIGGESSTVAAALQSNAQANEDQPARIDPKALAALDNMGKFLRQQQSFTVHTQTDTDYVLDSGETIRMSAHGDLRVRRPDRLRADVVSDRKPRQFYYDGKTFTIYGPRLGYYAVVAAPPCLNDLATELQTDYGLELPLVDLFRWGTDMAGTPEITEAKYIGPTTIDGVAVDHYAFRQPGLDWQIWIQQGTQPLPRKLLLTTTDDPARPEFASELKWELNAKHEDSEFAFVPPKGTSQITMAQVDAQPIDTIRNARRSPHSNLRGTK